jgi:hypothetical protein
MQPFLDVDGWLTPVRTEHAVRVRLLLALAGGASCVVGAQMLVLGLRNLGFLAVGVPLTVLGFLAMCLGLALVAQGLMPWETGAKTTRTKA